MFNEVERFGDLVGDLFVDGFRFFDTEVSTWQQMGNIDVFVVIAALYIQ